MIKNIHSFFGLLLLLGPGISGGYAQPLSGFSAGAVTKERETEGAFLTVPDSAMFRAHLEAITAEPHPAGSAENNRVADYLVQAMEKAGFQVERYPYDIYMPIGPGEVRLDLVTPQRRPLPVQENILPDDPFSADPRLTHGWNSYSGSGDVTAQVVYANYGTKEDFEQLQKLGISVAGKIVLARYGGNFRGYKAKYAQAAGAAGLLIFTDPKDSGYARGLVYPEGKQFSESTIQRGSVLTLDWTGDPLTPFEPALPLDDPATPQRLDPATVPFHTIPVTPVGYGAASEILSRMTGQPVPPAWQGGLPFTYRLEGGADLTVRLSVQQPLGYVRVQNVVGTLTGSEFPDEWIVMGSHYDAWTFGATDPNSGTAMLLSVADALGELARQGRRPRRTIKIAHWDAEEHGIIGSTEWVEQFREELDRKAVAYFNADGACSGLDFGASSSPSLKRLLIESTQVIPYPHDEQTVYDHWLSRSRDPGKGPSIGNLGGGSDHLGFYAHIGVPCLNAGMGGPTMYHSAYDNFHWYRTVGEPDFAAGPTVARVFGVMALRLANADILPYDVGRYAVDLKEHLQTVGKEVHQYYPGFSTDGLQAVVDRLGRRATEFEQRLSARLQGKGLPAETTRRLNQELLSLERCFVDEKGMAYGKWYRSLYASSDPFSGYASWMLPGFRYEAAMESTESLPELTQRYQEAFERLEKRIAVLNTLLDRK